MAQNLEELREVMRREVARSSVRDVARRAGVNKDAVRAFVADGSGQRPRGDNLRRLFAYAAETARSMAQETASVSQSEPNGLSDFARGVLHAARQMNLTVAALIDAVTQAPAAAATDAPPAEPPAPSRPRPPAVVGPIVRADEPSPAAQQRARDEGARRRRTGRRA